MVLSSPQILFFWWLFLVVEILFLKPFYSQLAFTPRPWPLVTCFLTLQFDFFQDVTYMESGDM